MAVRRLPHASGGPPHPGMRYRKNITFAPREWGSTRPNPIGQRHSLVCPTRVGVHPLVVLARARPAGLPHASGGPPDAAGHRRFTKGFAPREWGSTQLAKFCEPRHDVCPTRVGVHPTTTSSPCRGRSLPHASGGPPLPRLPGRCRNRFAPREWGSTRRCSSMALRPVVCPTRVGVHL